MPPMAFVDDGAFGTAGSSADEKAGDRFDRSLGRGEADALNAPEPANAGLHDLGYVVSAFRRTTFGDHLFQSLQRQRQMRSAPGPDHRMNLVDDDGTNGPEEIPA